MNRVENEFTEICRRNRLLLYIGLSIGGIALIWCTNIMDSLFSF